jgi:ABC-type multidrug transport system ATPase subunit
MPDTKSTSSDTHTNQPLLRLEKVTFRYQKKSEPLLRSVDFELMPGERVSIIGDNGSGKSTLAKLLLGLHKPEEGSVSLFEKKVNWGNHYPLLGYIGDPSYSPGGLGLPVGILVGDLVATFKKLGASSSQGYDFELEKQLALESFYANDVAKLSKGQRMRLMAFLALAKQPKLLIADEATEGLDKDSREAVLSAIQKASNHSKFGMLWISHRRYEVTLLTNTVYELSNGQLNRSYVNGFACEMEVDLTANRTFYRNLCKDEALEVVSEVFINSQVSSFKFTGKKRI